MRRRCHALGETTGGGGCPSTYGIPASIDAQDGALRVQIVIIGLAISGSSSVPKRIVSRCGRASDCVVTGVPHCGQKRRCMRLPLAARLE